MTEDRAGSRQFLIAIAIAAASDILSFSFALAPPLQWSVDIVTAVLLYRTCRRGWATLAGFIAEAIPGLAVFPTWTVVVLAIYIRRGSVRRDTRTPSAIERLLTPGDSPR
jgi:hypothetical protein